MNCGWQGQKQTSPHKIEPQLYIAKVIVQIEVSSVVLHETQAITSAKEVRQLRPFAYENLSFMIHHKIVAIPETQKQQSMQCIN